MDSTVEFEPFRVDRRGVVSVFKGAGMRAALASAASGLRARADAAARPDPALTTQAARYASGVDMGSFTALGWVGTGNRASRIDQADNHTLDRFRH